MHTPHLVWLAHRVRCLLGGSWSGPRSLSRVGCLGFLRPPVRLYNMLIQVKNQSDVPFTPSTLSTLTSELRPSATPSICTSAPQSFKNLLLKICSKKNHLQTPPVSLNLCVLLFGCNMLIQVKKKSLNPKRPTHRRLSVPSSVSIIRAPRP